MKFRFLKASKPSSDELEHIVYTNQDTSYESFEQLHENLTPMLLSIGTKTDHLTQFVYIRFTNTISKTMWSVFQA